MPAYLKLFPGFLLITIIVEILSLYLWNNDIVTYKIYNFFTAFEFCFYLFILKKIINSLRVRKIIAYSIFPYFAVSFINILFFQKDSFHSITYSLGCLLIVTYSVYYFFELFQSPKSIRLTNEPSFWICSGLLFYYCCSFPFLGLTSLLSTMPKILLYNVQNILVAINILLYSSFTIAFLCKIQIRKYTLR
ncbi:MAG: hypothetical protein JWM28_2698 [Chitinophagaceae bacterium]|nr:hypothetical protein [Chitinophagaceae bacterium]